jgi:lysophospholipase L1-like esterase
MQEVTVEFFATILNSLNPAPQDTPKTFQLQQGQQLAAIGDSITWAAGYVHMTDAVLAQQYGDLKLPKVLNVGICGHKAEDLVARFQKDVVDHKPAIVTINIGINDVWHRMNQPHDPEVLKAYKENVAKMVDMAQKAGIKVILLTPTTITEDPNAEGNKRLAAYVAAEKEIAAQKKCQLVDLHRMFLDALKKKPAELVHISNAAIQAEPSAPNYHKGNWMTDDGVHMNERGNAIMAVGVLRALGVPDSKIAQSDWPPKKADK